jgi:hypothetical protein
MAKTQTAKAEAQEAGNGHKAQLIGDDLVAVSPLPAWPGRIVFPEPYGRVYTAFNSAVKRRPDEDENDFSAYKPHWRGVVAIAEIQIDGVTSLEFDDVHLDVIRWAVYATDEYIRRFFRQPLWGAPPISTEKA